MATKKINPYATYFLLCAVVASVPTQATAQITGLANINVTGQGLVPTETDYVPHVVACENGSASFEALKAQAVAARSFAYYKMELFGVIGDGTGDQVYSCGNQPNALPNAAANATEGEILTYQNNVIASFYVAAAIPSDPSGQAQPGDPDPTNTEQWVTYTYLDGLIGSRNRGSPLGFLGNPRNRGAKSQNGADFLSDNGRNYVDILKFYYGADIQLESVVPGAGQPALAEKTLAGFEVDEGYFPWSPTLSGSNLHLNAAGMIAEQTTAASHSGNRSQRLVIDYDEASDPGDEGFFYRHLSGTDYGTISGTYSSIAGTAGNIRLESIGSVGLWLKTDDPGLEVSIAIDDPSTGEQGVFRDVAADGAWHKYEWFLGEDAQWDAWVGGNGTVGDRFTIDSIQFVGNADVEVFFDDLFYNPSNTVPPIPGDFNSDGDVDGTDFILWQIGVGDFPAGGATLEDGDANGDGFVNGDDFLIWQSNFSTAGASAEAATVPEPAAFVVALIVLWSSFARRMMPLMVAIRCYE